MQILRVVIIRNKQQHETNNSAEQQYNYVCRYCG
jgi:hypothetical protein